MNRYENVVTALNKAQPKDGYDVNMLIASLKSSGLSVMESIRAVCELTGRDLAQAKDYVTQHPSYVQEVLSADQVHEVHVPVKTTHHTRLSYAEATEIMSEDITVRRQKELIAKADSRMHYIMSQIEEIVGRTWDWFDFDNEDGSDNGNPVRGYFDKDDYRTWIGITGEFTVLRNGEITDYDNGFPTEWLWLDFEDTLSDKIRPIEEKKAQEEKRARELKEDRESRLAQIREHLPEIKAAVYEKTPPEIRNMIKFKSAEEIYQEEQRIRQMQEDQELQAIRAELVLQREKLRQSLSAEEFNAVELRSAESVLQERRAKTGKKNKPK